MSGFRVIANSLRFRQRPATESPILGSLERNVIGVKYIYSCDGFESAGSHNERDLNPLA